ncbi:thioredoxin family protein [Clostridium lundense]|uniref:thioredoxin family protein n=1 Tax=Clostridium lundense TaxID=319475 RepID=UPI0004862045|nr:thioredoxin family protein [Clostridium lundense]
MEILNSVEHINSFIKENKICIVYFSSNRCGVCINLLPKIDEILKSYPMIKGGKIDIDKVQEAIGSFSVHTLPCILLFIDGKEIIREARFISIIELKEKIKRYYELLEE